MAEPQEQSQAEAEKKMAVPQGTLDHLSELREANANARGEWLKEQEALKEAAKEYGFQTPQQFLNHVGSDAVFAQRIVTDLLTGKDATVKGVLLPDSPQENNVTGRLDHTVSPAVKVTHTEVPEPVNDGPTATASEPVVTQDAA